MPVPNLIRNRFFFTMFDFSIIYYYCELNINKVNLLMNRRNRLQLVELATAEKKELLKDLHDIREDINASNNLAGISKRIRGIMLQSRRLDAIIAKHSFN